MVFLWILAGLLGLVLLLLLLPVGARVSFGQGLRVDLKIGPFAIGLVPAKEKKKKKKEPEPPVAEDAAKPEKKSKKPFPKPTFQEIKEALPFFGGLLKKTLHRVRKRIVIAPLELSVTFGSPDPSETAQWYGLANSVMWSVMPQIEERVTVRSPHIHLGMDFDSGKTEASGTVGFHFLIFDLVVIGLAAGLPILKWIKQFKKKHENDAKTDNKTEQKKPLPEVNTHNETDPADTTKENT